MPRTEDELIDIAINVCLNAARSRPQLNQLPEVFASIILQTASREGLNDHEKFFIISNIAITQNLLNKNCQQIFALFEFCGFFNAINVFKEVAGTQDMQFLDSMIGYYVYELCKIQGAPAQNAFNAVKREALTQRFMGHPVEIQTQQQKEFEELQRELEIHKKEIDESDSKWGQRVIEVIKERDDARRIEPSQRRRDEIKAMEADPESYDNLPKSRVREVREMHSPISGKTILTAFQPFVSEGDSKKR